MKELDLIPNEYRVFVSKLRVVKLFVLGLTGLCMFSLVSYVTVSWSKHQADIKVAELSKQKASTDRQKERLSQLSTQKQELDYKLDLLQGLRGVTSPEDLFHTIDDSMGELKVWLVNLRYERVESIVEDPNNVETGYFVILSPNNEVNTLAVGTQLVIQGSAFNHSAISEFVKNLLHQKTVSNAVIKNTSTRGHGGQAYIDFIVEVRVNEDRGPV